VTDLPVVPPRPGRGLLRLVVVWLGLSGAVLLLPRVLPAYRLGSWPDALAVGAALGVVNAVVWPVLVRMVLGFTVLTLGLGAFLLYGLVVLLALHQLPGVTVTGDAAAGLAAIALGGVAAGLTGLLDIDDDEFFQRRAARRARRRRGAPSAVPGVVFVQIDGLGHDVLRRAVRDGDAPTLAAWLAGGSHRLVAWETDWSSQTSASQCALLHGSNEDIPAFRWYEKVSGRLMVSNRRGDAAEIERRHSDGRGLLHADGTSRGNLFTGDAAAAVMTMSVAGRRRGRVGTGYYGYLANPSNASRTLFATIAEVGRELAAAAAQRRRGVRPRVPRGGWYPALRAFTTVVSRDVVVSAVLDDMMAGRSVVYANLLGYDEVAHHSGIERYDTLAVLRGIDRQLGRLARAAALAPRPYRLVVLSDHGQTQGEPFADKYGHSLEDLVRGARGPGTRRRRPGSRSDLGDAWQVSAGLADAAAGRGPVAAMARQCCMLALPGDALPDGDAPLLLRREADRAATEEAAAAGGVLVLASGSMGMVYFTDRPGRLTREEVDGLRPGLVDALAGHPGIGFVLVRTAADGPVVFGPAGHHALLTGEVVGEDPLAPYGPLARQRVLRADGFAHTADIVVNAAYESETDEVSAFERLVGSHGGMGGAQSRPFLLFPADLAPPPDHLLGAEMVHALLRRWLADLGHDAFARPRGGRQDTRRPVARANAGALAMPSTTEATPALYAPSRLQPPAGSSTPGRSGAALRRNIGATQRM